MEISFREKPYSNFSVGYNTIPCSPYRLYVLLNQFILTSSSAILSKFSRRYCLLYAFALSSEREALMFLILSNFCPHGEGCSRPKTKTYQETLYGEQEPPGNIPPRRSTWLTRSRLGNAQRLLQEFEARLQAQRGSKSRKATHAGKAG